MAGAGRLRVEMSGGENERTALGAAGTVTRGAAGAAGALPRDTPRESAPQPPDPLPESREKPSFRASERVETPKAQKKIRKNWVELVLVITASLPDTAQRIHSGNVV